MHPRVFDEFDRICRERRAGGDVLEIGTARADTTLLRLPALEGARSRVGVNMEEVPPIDGIRHVRANANDLRLFADESFDTVLCNAVLEHDPFFWRSLAEMRRVAKPGGLIVIGVPGFAKLPAERVVRRVARQPVVRSIVRRWAPDLAAATVCLQVHLFPGDYYRFSSQAVHEVFMEGLDEVEVRTVLVPPRLIGMGVKP